ncbi:MAG: methionyl-tRNA formyltransferase [Erysipelotrichaceae bacterium]|nr:methionyl-tRNA formyltransferase [Erysipelotrichaceae bacterium]
MNYRQRIVFMGTPQFAADILKGLLEAGFNVVGVVSQPDKVFGRKHLLKPSEVKETALKYNLPVITPVKIRNEYDEILKLDPELIITAAYGQIIPKELLDYPRYHCINTHGSLLPKYRGASPIQTAIMNGETQTGMTIMYMNEKMDEGDILYQETIDIDIHDTATVMFNKMSRLALDMLLKILPDIFEEKVNPIPQDHAQSTYAHLLDKETEHVGFKEDTLATYNHIRGLLEQPGCYFVMKGRKYKIEEAFFELRDHTEPGVFKGLEEDYLRLDCNDGFIKVYRIRPEGKGSMDARAFYNGTGRTLTGEQLG